MNVLFSNYHWENDENGKDRYDYAREFIFEERGEENGWATADDVPEREVYDEVATYEEFEWDDFKREFGRFIENSRNGFLLCGTVGTWRGRFEGGSYVNSFSDLAEFWKDCDYIKVYDEKGHLHIEASHHDGTNYAELKELTDKGSAYKDNHYYDSDREVHGVIFNNNFFSRLPHYAHKVWGCKKAA